MQRSTSSAANRDRGPVAVRYPRDKVEGVEVSARHQEQLEKGKAQVLHEGSEVAIIAVGPMLYRVMESLPQLIEQGIDPTIVNARFLKPFDEELVCDLARNGFRLVTVEEHALAGGFGSAVIEGLEFHGLSETAVLRLGIPDEFIEHGTRSQLLESLQLTPSAMAERIIRFAKQSTSAKI